MSSSPAVNRSSVQLDISARSGREHVAFLRRKLTAALAMMPTKLRHVSIALVGDALMARLHVQFMNVAGPTDVLTFELEHDLRGRVTAGEIILCVPEARRSAREYRIPVQNELLLYAIHGLLHLSGYDDRTKADFQAIHREEDRILVALKVGAVFEPPERDTVTPPRAGRKPTRKAARKKDGRSR